MKGTKEIIKYILCCECLKKDKNDDNKYNVTKKVANDNRGFSINEDTVIDYQPNRGVSILNDRELAFDNQGTIKSVGTNYSTAQTLDDVIPTLKIMMLGDGSVGKSSLILQYMYKEFLDEYEPTKADSYRKTIALNGEQVIVDILDTAGQEEYQAIRDTQLKRRHGFMLVFDLTNKESFERIVYHRENLMRVKNEEGSIIDILVGNKCDLVEDRQVTTEEAIELAKRYNINYIETSALTGQNVDRAFSELLLKVLFKKYPNKNDTWKLNSIPIIKNGNLKKKPTFVEIFSSKETNE